MKHLNLAPRRALRRGALALGVATASLAFASAAGAAVITVNPDGTSGSDNFTAALNQANTNSSTSNTIVLKPGKYLPLAAPLTVTKNLTITGDHSVQASLGIPAYDLNGSTAQAKTPTANFLVVNAGVSLTVEGININSAGTANQTAVVDNGTLTTWGATIAGSNGHALSVPNAAKATLNETTLVGNGQDQILNSGTLALNNSDVVGGGGAGIVNSGGTFSLNNTLLAAQVGLECIGGQPSNGGPGSMTDDTSCTVQYANDPTVSTYTYTPSSNGGPATTVKLPAGNVTTNKGVNCPTVDERFFPNPVSAGTATCDIGAVTNAATQQTTAPSCVSTAIIAGPPKQQQVTLSDSGSGIGPNPGPATDNASNTPPTTNPGAASPLAGYAVDNLWINNGSVSFTSPLSPTNNGVVLTATKTNAASGTQWNFTGTNWAGVPKFCN